MSKKPATQNSFNAGETTFPLYGRQDLDKYNNSVREAVNFVVLPQGPISKRMGTEFVSETNNNGEVRLLPFQFSVNDSFLVVMGHENAQFAALGAMVELSGSPVTVTTPYDVEDLADITHTPYGDYIYLAHGDYPTQVLQRNSTTDWEINDYEPFPPPTYEAGYLVPSTLTPGATSGFGVTFTASTSIFNESDIGRQIVYNNGPGRASITTYSTTTSVIADIIEPFASVTPIIGNTWHLDASPYADLAYTQWRAGFIATFTGKDPGTSTNRNTWRPTDVGRYIVADGGIAQITKWDSASAVKAEILKSFNTPNTTTNKVVWTLEDTEWTSTRGYPKAVGMWNERLVLASTNSKPSTVWFSENALLDAHGRGPDDDDAIVKELFTPVVNEVKWITSSRDLVLGTTGAEITIVVSGTGGVSSDSIRQVQRTTFGSNSPQNVPVGTEVLFVQGTGKKIRSFFYDFNIDGYKGDDLFLYAAHIADVGVKEIAFTQEPNSTIYAVLNDGTLVVGTYQRDQQIIGWTRWETDGYFENVCKITEDNTDSVYFVVRRDIDGSTKRYIEKLSSNDGTGITDSLMDSSLSYHNPVSITAFDSDTGVFTVTGHGLSDGNDIRLFDFGGFVATESNGYTGAETSIWYIDDATTDTFKLIDFFGNPFLDFIQESDIITVDGSTFCSLVTTISGLDHLEGKEVMIRADGGQHVNKTVTGGSISLDYPCYAVVVGLPYTSTLVTHDLDFDNGSQGQRMRRVNTILRVNDSVPPTVNGTMLPARSAEDLMSTSVPLYSGDYYYGELDWGNDGRLTIESTDVFPLTILGIFGSAEIGIR